MITFKAAVFSAPGQLTVKSVEVPDLADNEVLVKVERCGICGSDLNIYHRDPPIPKYWPGHEMAGSVVKSGKKVKGLKEGMKVSVAPLIPCKKCNLCKMKKENICSDCLFLSFNLPGGFAEFIKAPKENIFPLPDRIDFDEAVLIEPLADVLHAMDLIGGVKNKKVIVIGCGTIGLLTVNVSRYSGAKEIIATGKYDYQCKLAKEIGADSVFSSHDSEIVNNILLNLKEEKADIIFETVGGYDSQSIAQSISLLKPTGTVILSGVHYRTPQMNLKYLTEMEMNLRGTQRYKKKNYIHAIDLLDHGAIKGSMLITHKVSLSQINEGYHIAFNKAETKAVKVVVVP